MIKTEKLGMRYGPVRALNDVSFEVKQGEVIGLLGPNGAGKSTTLKILTSYIYPTYGTAYVNGIDVRENPIPIRQMIGYLPEQLPLYTDMEVGEYLRFVGNARSLYGGNLTKRLEWVTEKCGLKPVYRKLIHQLSKGYRQRTALAQALIHDPQIVILDEPTSGLDPHQILEIRSLVKELAQQKTIIFSTHILQEVQAITHRIIIINRGKIVADGTVEALEKTMEHRRYELTMSDTVPEAEVVGALKNKVPEVKKIESKYENGVITYLIQGTQAQSAMNALSEGILMNGKSPVRQEDTVLKALSQVVKQRQWDFLSFHRLPFTLEEIFLKLTEPEKALSTKGV
jgi:ABC-2 type transport system ATP-binding protein